MSLKQISQCAKDLNFQPRAKWPAALPAVCWKGQLLCGFDRLDGVSVDVSETQNCALHEAIFATYPRLGLGELSRLIRLLRLQDELLFNKVTEPLLAKYSLRWSERLANTFEKLNETPKVFQDWLDDKQCGPRDVASLLAVNDPNAIEVLLEHFTLLNLSKSSGVQALELAIELYLLEAKMADLLPGEQSGEEWLKKLVQWRRPETSRTDSEMAGKVRRWPWPSHVQAEWVRRGDESGVAIHIHAKSAEDLELKLKKLGPIPQAWRQ